MQAIEFTSKIKNGVIEIPLKYKQFVGKIARIIVLTDDDAIQQTSQDRETIQSILQQLGERGVFKGISDPVAWQRSIRDEWN